MKLPVPSEALASCSLTTKVSLCPPKSAAYVISTGTETEKGLQHLGFRAWKRGYMTGEIYKMDCLGRSSQPRARRACLLWGLPYRNLGGPDFLPGYQGDLGVILMSKKAQNNIRQMLPISGLRPKISPILYIRVLHHCCLLNNFKHMSQPSPYTPNATQHPQESTIAVHVTICPTLSLCFAHIFTWLGLSFIST